MRHAACMYALFSIFAASTTRERVASEGGHFSLHLLAHTLSPGFTQGQLELSFLHPGSCVDRSPLMLMNGSITVTFVLEATVNGVVAMV